MMGARRGHSLSLVFAGDNVYLRDKSSFMKLRYALLLILPLSILLFLASCKTRPPAGVQPPVTEAPPPPADTKVPPPPPDRDENKVMPVIDSIDCRVVVEFGSAGQGINNEARMALEHFQMKFSMDQGLPMRPRRQPKGREGEMVYCYPLYGFPEDKAVIFVKELKALLGNEPLVFIHENKRQSLH